MRRRPLPLAPELAARMQALRARGASFDLIAASLNQIGVRAHLGGRWYAASVRLALRKAGAAPDAAKTNND
ncbi:hypothetical protein [Massilia cavernae]|uniref:Recombinase domain-containing protein n=1 Tax=Massilia cavernae TaxID=2320864 RepID=A0A418Y7U0_9BURK|nr:hypothetical protein [Massilia cavernae]RJG27184.1 hypothetical protein D3872_01685 [Massilia cavernae]